MLLACCAVNPAPAASVVLRPVADTTLSENYPSNNFGSLSFFNAGTTQNRTRNRALLQFDLTLLPSRAQVRAASLALEVTGEPNEPPAFSDFGIHRVLRAWAEGSKLSPTNCVSCQGQGSAASAGETTWHSRFAFGEVWNEPGGAIGIDFATQASSATTIYGISASPYVFPSTGALVADVQSWLNDPGENHGWALICQSETVPFTARRFGSREDPLNWPRLAIDYVAPPVIENLREFQGNIEFSFTALPNEEYLVEYRQDVLAAWQVLRTVEPVPEPTRTVIRDPATASRRFYRVVAR